MLALDTAIVSAFTGSATLTAAFPGGIHGDRAPEGTTATPYLIYTVIGGPSDKMFGGAERSEVTVRFQAVGVGKNATGQAMNTFTGVFDDAILSLGTGQNCNCTRTTRPIPSLYGPVDGSGNELWMWRATYVYAIRN